MSDIVKLTNDQIKAKVSLIARKLGGKARYNESRAGVPRVIINMGDCYGSLVYIANNDQWKLFYPFPANVDDQDRIYFESENAMMKFMNKSEELRRAP